MIKNFSLNMTNILMKENKYMVSEIHFSSLGLSFELKKIEDFFFNTFLVIQIT